MTTDNANVARLVVSCPDRPGIVGGGLDVPGERRREFSNWRDEQRAWKQTAVLFDQSFHMLDVYVKGPDTKRLLSDLSVNSFATYGRSKAKQFVVCNPDGYVIGDAVLFGLEDEQACIVGRPATGNWVSFHAETGDYDVEITRDERTLDNDGGRLTFRYQVQGPNGAKILDAAVDGGLPGIPFFNLGEITIAGVPVRALNHSMSRVPGLELVGPANERQRVWEAILQAGEDFDLRPGGGRAYSTVAIESGWIPSVTPAIYSGEAMRPYHEWLPGDGWEATASIGGSFVSDDIEDYYQRPWNLGLGRTIKLDHDFIGREALEAVADEPHRQKVWLRWNDDDVVAVYRSMLGGAEPQKYMDLPVAHYATLPFDQILKGDQLVGLSTYPVYTANVGGWFSLCMVDADQAIDGAELTVVWGEPSGGTAKPVVERHVQTTIRATLSTESPAAWARDPGPAPRQAGARSELARLRAAPHRGGQVLRAPAVEVGEHVPQLSAPADHLRGAGRCTWRTVQPVTRIAT